MKKGDTKTLRRLIDNGEDINQYTNTGHTILTSAISTPSTFTYYILKFLLENGADPNLANKHGETPLTIAVTYDKSSAVKVLLVHGADPNLANKSGETPLTIAAMSHNVPIAKHLLTHGAVDPPGTLTFRTIDTYAQLLGTINMEDKYILQQYTRHGDYIINSLLRGTDTIDTYESDIVNDEIDIDPNTQTIDQDEFFCIILSELSPGAIKLFYAKKSKTFYKLYVDTIYPRIESKFVENDLAFFRNMTYNVIKKLYKAIRENTKRNETVFKTYRGTNVFYLNTDATAIFKLPTFHSTSLSKDVAYTFGTKMYIFNIHPECTYMYMEPFTLVSDEYELLLAPGNRYAFLKEERNTQTYAVLPPEKDYELPDTYSDYLAYLRSSISKNHLNEENLTRFNRSRMAGGYKTTRKQRHGRRRGTRRNKLRKQRGAGNEGSNMNRWTQEPPMIELETRDANDTQMIQTMLRDLA